MPASPELTGGEGFSFEDGVVATYLTSVLVGGGVRGLPEHVATQVLVQRAALGHPLDDVIVEGEDRLGATGRLSLQVKKSLTVSDAESNRDFRDVVWRAWVTVFGREFSRGRDRVGAATSQIALAAFRDVRTTCEWARASVSGADFSARLGIAGFASEGQREFVAAIRRIVAEGAANAEQPRIDSAETDDESVTTSANMQDAEPNDDQIREFLSHFVLLRFDLRQEGAEDDASSIERLRVALGAEGARAPELWTRLLVIARGYAGMAASADRVTLLSTLASSFAFASTPRYARDLVRIAEEARHSLRDIRLDVGGTKIARAPLLDQARELLEGRRLLHLTGAAGSGKSAMLRRLADGIREDGFALVLKADRLVGPGWAGMAAHLRLEVDRLDDLLVELAASSSPVLFIDGIDRVVDRKERAVLRDVVHTILENPALSKWRLVATMRDGNVEHVRTWLPEALLEDGQMAFLSVPGFEDADAEELAMAQPVLRPLLFGEAAVREIARRPFFLDVLARALSPRAVPPAVAFVDVDANGPAEPVQAVVPEGQQSAVSADQIASEPALIAQWWRRGGYDAEREHARRRQSTLLDLVRRGARTLGRHVSTTDIEPATLQSLVDDGILRDDDDRVHVSFRHDIFFEWAFYQACAARQEVFLLSTDRTAATEVSTTQTWLDEIIAAGELPPLGRVVELLSQATLERQGAWERSLAALEAGESAGTRSQWTRAWLLAPFGAPRFATFETTVTASLLARPMGRVDRLLVWFRAAKTEENPLVITGEIGGADLDRLTRLQMADAFAWPRELATWSRFVSWVLAHAYEFSVDVIPDVLEVFQVWLNALGDYPTQITDRIRELTLRWLIELEEHQHPEHFNWDPNSKWRALQLVSSDELEVRLRRTFLRAALSRTETLTSYLERLATTPRLLSPALNTVIQWSPRVAPVAAEALANVLLSAVLEPLPSEVVARSVRNGFWSAPHFDWHSPGIRNHVGEFVPASPVREPFASLFRHAPRTALGLVRRLSNHATTAWRELHEFDRNGRGTPLPIVLSFPWGQQEFWGSAQVYTWFRGNFAHGVLASALMALEDWAFSQVEEGRDVDQVIRDVVEETQCAAALGIALTIALDSGRVSAATLPLVTCQRLWYADIQRCVTVERSLISNEVGANWFAGSAPHVAALKRINARPVRGLEIRALVTRFALSSETTLRQGFEEALRRFPAELPFEYAEEALVPERAASLQQTAEVWAELANQANYSVQPTPDGRGLVVSFDNPLVDAPHVQSATAAHAELNARVAPWAWAVKCFEEGRLTGAPLATMVSAVRERDTPDLFNRATQVFDDADVFLSMEQAGVAATAAVLLTFGDSTDGAATPAHVATDVVTGSPSREVDRPRSELSQFRGWAIDVIYRAARMQIPASDTLADLASADQSAARFAAIGLGAIVRSPASGDDVEAARRVLLRLVCHPADGVAAEALAQALRSSLDDAPLAWASLAIAVECAIGDRNEQSESAGETEPRGGSELPDEQAEFDSAAADLAGQQPLASFGDLVESEICAEALASARDAVENHTLPTLLPMIPDPWVTSPGPSESDPGSVPRRATPGSNLGFNEGPRRPSTYLRTERMASVLRVLSKNLAVENSVSQGESPSSATPRREVVLGLADALLRWTISRCDPPEGLGRRPGSGDRVDVPIQWLGAFMPWLAVLGSALDANAFRVRFIAPLLSLPKVPRAACLRWLIPTYVAAAVIDPQHVADGVILLLSDLIAELANDEAVRYARRRPSRGLDADYQAVFSACLCADWETPAPAAARFANGDWSEIRILQPLLRNILSACGDLPTVLSGYLSVVERSLEVYPFQDFLEEVGLIPSSSWTTRTLWMSNLNASRIAALIQRLAEKQQFLSQDHLTHAARLLDRLVDVGDRRSAALQVSELFSTARAAN